MLEIQRVSKRFQSDIPVLSDIDLQIERSEVICLLGPSGCGKTTLLRVVAGLEIADQGRVLLDGVDLADIPIHKRNFGFMFQDFALFPHKTVGENIAFGLRMANWSDRAIAERVATMLSLTELPASYADRTVFELSGGERQRVALARSLAPQPALLMLDEPLGNLDRALRESLMIDLRTILKRLGVTAIYVTHDQAEAYAVADRIVLMNRGRIAQIGLPEEIYMRPATTTVARFLGYQNLLSARVTDGVAGEIATTIGRFRLSSLPSDLREEKQYRVLLHPQAVQLVPRAGAGEDAIHGLIEQVSFRGDRYEVVVKVAGPDSPTRLLCDVMTYAHFLNRNEVDGVQLTEGAPVALLLNSELMFLLGEGDA